MEPDSSSPCWQQPATFPVLNQINPVHALPTNFFKTCFNIIFPSTPRFSKWSLSLRLKHQNSLWTYSFPHMSLLPRPSHSSWFDHLDSSLWTLTIKELLVSEILQSPVTSSLLDPNIFFSTLFSNTLSLHYSPNVRDKFLYLCTTTGNIVVLYILIFIFGEQTRGQKILYWRVAGVPWVQYALHLLAHRN